MTYGPAERERIAAILDEPAAVEPRRAYADWLHAEGDEARAKVVRASCPGAVDREALEAGLAELDATQLGWSRGVGARLVREMCALGLDRFLERWLAAARPALELLIGDAIDDAPIGASRLWGDPDLPPGTAWPTLADCRRWEPDIPLPEDSPCQFVAQLDLAALARSPAARALPAEGLLSLFAHHDWQTGSSSACLRYFESTEGLERVPHAETHPDNARRPPHVASLVEALTIPEGHAGPFVERMGIEPGDWDTIDRHREVLLLSGGGVLGVPGRTA